jgi:large subunit ribosomal protein L10
MMESKISKKKIEEVKSLKALLGQFKVVGLAKVEKVPAKALHNLRDTLRGDVAIRMSKKKLINKAFSDVGKTNLTELSDMIEGITALLFTDMDPIKLAQFLESKAVKGAAKAGDLAPIPILVKAGDTKIAPGPIISELNQILKVPTMIKNGTIHIRTDTVTHIVGALIDAKQAQLLGRLGIEPMEIKLDFYAAWENGEIIPPEVLHLDQKAILNDVKLAASQALNIALGLGMINKRTVDALIGKAARIATGIALKLPIFIPGLLEQYLAKAVREAKVINSSVLGDVEAEADEPEEKKEVKKEKKPSKDEDVSGGLGNLFG